MKKNPNTWLERWFWPTELAYRFRHCYARHGAKTYGEVPAMERPPCPNRRGPRKHTRKKLRLRPAFARQHNDAGLPF